MKTPHNQLSVPLLALACLFAGCTQPPHSGGRTGFPVHVGVQDANGLPVDLQVDNDKPLPVEARLRIEKKMPVELVLEDGQSLPVEAKLRVDNRIPVELVIPENKPLTVEANLKPDALTVKLAPDRVIWIAIAIAGLIALSTMLAAFASCRAAINAKKAAEKLGK